MNLLRLLLGAAAVAAILAAFRDFENRGWLRPALPRPIDYDLEEEPILGYDGMDQETLLDWLGDADLDSGTLMRMRAYEQANRRREPVIAALEDMM